MPRPAPGKRKAIRDLIRNNPAIALIAGSILGPPPGLTTPGSQEAADLQPLADEDVAYT